MRLCLMLALLGLLPLWSGPVGAQPAAAVKPAPAAASAAGPAASAVGRSHAMKPGAPLPRRSAAEQRDAAAMPGDLRPEHPVTPQLRIPLTRPPQAARPVGSAASAGR